MPAPLLGLLLMVCPQHCELPLPHAALELRVAASQWQWCLRVDAAAGWRLCDADVSEWLRRQRAGVQALPMTITGKVQQSLATTQG